MTKVTLGNTGICVNKNGFGALPIQRRSKEDAIRILRKAYDCGINFFDTARAYSDSEEKIGLALSDVRSSIFISTKTMSLTGDGIRADLETSLVKLKTNYVDIYQLHNPAVCPKPGDGSGVYETLLELKASGKIRHIGITNHRLHVAKEAILSGLYETLQFPFCYLSDKQEIELVTLCKEHNMGFIAMKALSGGLITRSDAAYAFMQEHPTVLPIWGIQHEKELDEFLDLQEKETVLSDEIKALIAHDKAELAGAFCRGCGYCMPCPVGIQINNCARMSLMLRRAPSANWLSPTWQANMEKITECLHCNSCKSKCPYGLDTPALLLKNLLDYRAFSR